MDRDDCRLRLSNRLPCYSISRRAFLRDGALILAAASAAGESRGAAPRATEPDEGRSGEPLLRIGLVTDLHYADKPTAGTRFYRRAIERLETAVERFNAEQVDLIVELGDLVDAAAAVKTELAWLAAINRVFAGARAPRHCVLGNHCVDALTKEEFLGGVEQATSYYSFDAGGHHIVVLDACFRSDGKPYGRKNARWDDANVSGEEIEWLRGDLAATRLPTLVFIHQRLDSKPPYGVKNAAEVRKTLEAAGNVRAVFQGHEHKNDHRRLGGIHYTTLAALVEGGEAGSNAYGIVELLTGGAIAVRGFARQASYAWHAPRGMR